VTSRSSAGVAGLTPSDPPAASASDGSLPSLPPLDQAEGYAERARDDVLGVDPQGQLDDVLRRRPPDLVVRVARQGVQVREEVVRHDLVVLGAPVGAGYLGQRRDRRGRRRRRRRRAPPAGPARRRRAARHAHEHEAQDLELRAHALADDRLAVPDQRGQERDQLGRRELPPHLQGHLAEHPDVHEALQRDGAADVPLEAREEGQVVVDRQVLEPGLGRGGRGRALGLRRRRGRGLAAPGRGLGLLLLLLLVAHAGVHTAAGLPLPCRGIPSSHCAPHTVLLTLYSSHCVLLTLYSAPLFRLPPHGPAANANIPEMGSCNLLRQPLLLSFTDSTGSQLESSSADLTRPKPQTPHARRRCWTSRNAGDPSLALAGFFLSGATTMRALYSWPLIDSRASVNRAASVQAARS